MDKRQERREKVIKALKYLHDVKRWSPDESEESITARRNITGDALALLKAQEPRVMAGAELTDAELIEKIRKAPIAMKPIVNAAPVVHGRWTERHVDYASDCAIDEIQTAKCSVCGLYHTTPYMYSFTDYKFCPHCGAKNVEE